MQELLLTWIVLWLSALLNSCGLEGHDGALDDVDTFAQLVLLDDEGRGQADDVPVGGLGQQSVVTKA